MRLAIMQPYFLPYIGYFQLMAAVDKFVVYDDVNYINKGWINRNQILLNRQPYMFTIPLKEASQNKKINEISLTSDDKWRDKMLRTFGQSYKRAPMFNDVFPLVESIVSYPESNLATFIHHSLTQLCSYMNLKTVIVPSSTVYGNQHLKAQERIIDICIRENATVYVNAPNGKSLYDASVFSAENIELKFLEPSSVRYEQYPEVDFVPYLSIVDVLMFNDRERIGSMLGS